MRLIINMATLKIGGGENVGLNFLKSLTALELKHDIFFIVAKNSNIEKTNEKNKIKEMMKCFLVPAFLPPGWSPLPACSDDTLLTPQRSSSQFDHASNIPSLKSNTPRPVSQDNIVVPYKLIDSAPLMVTWVTPEEVVRTGGGRLLTTKPLMRPLPPH